VNCIFKNVNCIFKNPPKFGYRFLLFRNGKLCPLIPVYADKFYDFPIESSMYTNSYCTKYNLDRFPQKGDTWLPLPVETGFVGAET